MSTKDEPIAEKKAIALKFVLTIFVVGVLIITGLVFTVSSLYGHEFLVQKISSAKSMFAMWRLCIFIIIVGAWDNWIEKLSRWMHLSDAKKEFYLNYRGRFALWLLVVEALLIQDVLADFLAIFIN